MSGILKEPKRILEFQKFQEIFMSGILKSHKSTRKRQTM